MTLIIVELDGGSGPNPLRELDIASIASIYAATGALRILKVDQQVIDAVKEEIAKGAFEVFKSFIQGKSDLTESREELVQVTRRKIFFTVALMGLTTDSVMPVCDVVSEVFDEVYKRTDAVRAKQADLAQYEQAKREVEVECDCERCRKEGN